MLICTFGHFFDTFIAGVITGFVLIIIGILIWGYFGEKSK